MNNYILSVRVDDNSYKITGVRNHITSKLIDMNEINIVGLPDEFHDLESIKDFLVKDGYHFDRYIISTSNLKLTENRLREINEEMNRNFDDINFQSFVFEIKEDDKEKLKSQLERLESKLI